eukprot:9670251-Alexandrium_andersonii.AAC.1
MCIRDRSLNENRVALKRPDRLTVIAEVHGLGVLLEVARDTVKDLLRDGSSRVAPAPSSRR